MKRGFLLPKERFIAPVLSFIFLFAFFQASYADTPQLISFQGRIVDANSQPLADGTYSMTFRIFNVAVAGAALWTETQPTVSVANGLFSALLGSVTSLSSLGFNESYWLEITVGASTYTPRQQISSAAYALNIPDLRVTTAKIAPGTAGQILMSNGTPATTWTSMSGDATINSSGVVAIAADAVALGTDTTGNYAGSNAEGGSATNAFACSGDATCEIQSAIQSISNNSITIDALNTAGASTITLTNSDVTNVANINVADGALQIGGTSVISSARSISNVVDFTNTGNTTLGNAGTDTLTVYPNTMNLTGNVSKTFDIGPGALDTTLNITNSGAGAANLNVDGSVTATSFSGSASNALACSGDATCEANAITVTNDVTVSSGSVTVSTGNISVSTGNVIIAGTITTGIAATEIYQMNQAVRSSDAVTFAGITNSGNTTLGDAGADTLTLYSTTMDWNNVDEDKTIQVGSGVTDRTLNLTNPDVTGKANLNVEGTVTAFAFTGSSTNALACSGDATCETQSITVNSANTALTQGSGNALRVTTNSGYTEVGPQNASWSHFMTDRAAFYFNKPVVPAGNTYPYTNATYSLGTSSNRWTEVFWSSGAYLRNDQGGSIELGDSTAVGVIPYIDFHYGTGVGEDFNVRLINDATGRLTLNGNLNVSGTITGTLSGNATTATNLAGGSGGTVPYQSAANTTAMLAAGTSGYLLQSGGTGAPSWINATDSNTASTIVKRDASGNFSAGTITAPYYNVSAGNGYGLRFWSSDSYKIHMGNAAEYLYGPVTDYSIKMNMGSGVGRGFTWGASGVAPIAALNATSGNFQVAGTITNGGAITTPGYVSITGVSDSSGNLRFSAANPYISASSYFVAPGGAYFNSGTVYTEAAIQARGGISNDSANCGGYLCLNENTLVTGSGWLRVDGDEGLYMETWGGGWHMTDGTWMRSYNGKNVYTSGMMRADAGFDKGGVKIIKKVNYAQGANTTCGTSGWAVVACWPNPSGNLGNPDNGCPWSGSMVCMWTDGF